MPHTYVNPYNGSEEETCSVSFGSQAHVASVHDAQTEAQFNKSKLKGEWGVVKAKLNKGQIPDGTKVLAYEADSGAFKGYFIVKDGGKLKIVQYNAEGKRYELAADEGLVSAIMDNEKVKSSIPKATKPKDDGNLLKKLTGWEPDKDIADGSAYWAKLTKVGPKLPEGTVVAENDYYQARMIWDQSKFIVQGQTNDGDWENIERGYDAGDAASLFDDGWTTPKDNDATTPQPATPAAPSQAKKLGKADAKAIQESESLKQGDILAVAKSSSGETKYRIVMGDPDSANPFLVMAQAPGTTGWKKIDQGDWVWNLIDDGNAWYKPEKDPDPVAAPTPKPAVPQNSTSTGSMTDEDVATLFVQLKDQMAKEKGINIKGSNPDLDALVHKAIGDQTGYTAAEVKGKIDAYKASGKKLSALKKKTLKKQPPPPKPTPTNPDPVHAPNGVPTAATNDVFESIVNDLPDKVDKSLYSNEDVAGSYVIAKDKVVAESGGKWTLYTKSEEMDKAIYDIVEAQTGHTMKEAKHAIALYLSDPKNKLSKLKKSLVKQGKLKPEADTLKKKTTPAAVVADINAAADTGYTPGGHAANVDPPIPAAPFAARAKPPVADLKWTGTEVGSHHAKVYSDKDGNQWLFKPQEGFLTEVDVATAKLAKKLGHPAADTYKVTLDGKEGSLQRMFPGGDAFGAGFDPTKAPTAHILAVQKEHVLDWLFSNHDSHSANFVFDEDGNVVGIDKGQALKFFGRDELTWKTTVNQYQPAANKLWEEWAAGKNVALNDPSKGELKAFIDSVMSLDDNEFKEIFRSYAEAAKAKGALLTGSHWKHGVLKAQTIPTNDVDAFLDALVKRKNSLAKNFAKLHDDAKAERDKHVTPADTTAASVTSEPGDISHISEFAKNDFKVAVGSLFSHDSPQQIYEKLLAGKEKYATHVDPDLKALHQMSILQAVRIMDELKAKKNNVPNGHLYEKKLVAWMTSPEFKKAQQALKDKEEALKKVEQMKAAQPDLPADSALFKDIELEEVRQWQSEQEPWTPGQEASLKHYTSNQGYTEMNGNLRGQGYQNDRVDKHVKDARAGMRPMDRHIIAHRGTTAISFGLADNGSENDLLYSLVGTTHKQIGFSSASYGSKAGFGSKPVIIHFEIPPGAPAAFVRDISYYKHSTENEILLDHGYEVKILKVWETSGGWSKQYHVQVRVEGWEGKA